MNDERSPYLPPEANIAYAALPTATPITAGRWLRFGNLAIDYIGTMLFGLTIGIVAGVVYGEAGVDYLLSIPELMFAIAITLVYYIGFEALTGWTPGKLITGTRVVGEDGRRVGVGKIIGRTLARLVPFEPLSFFRSDARGWHDIWPGVYVINIRHQPKPGDRNGR